MRDEETIRKKLAELGVQRVGLVHKNPRARIILRQRIMALEWCLGGETDPILTKKELEFWKALGPVKI